MFRQAPFIRDRQQPFKPDIGRQSSMVAPGVAPLLHLADFLHRRDQACTVFRDEF